MENEKKENGGQPNEKKRPHRGRRGGRNRNKPKNQSSAPKATNENAQDTPEVKKEDSQKPAQNRNKNRHNHAKKPRPEQNSQPAPERVSAEPEGFGTGFMPETEPERKYMFDYDPQPLPYKPEEEKNIEVVGIKFRGGGKIYYFSPKDVKLEKGEHAIVETVRGVEYGDVALGNKLVGESEVVFPLKPILRKATKEDIERNAENRKLEERAKPIWQEKVAKNGLDMQLVDVEYTHDNAKLCFYFTADGRVDFRELVKDLAGVFRTRIELRQIGVRDEAKLFGGLGSCGRPFCCNTFLPDFAQVSIKMAKEQNLSLSSSKISGACGRLMCCLRFEHDTYERENATFPRVDTVVDTAKGRGVIVESNFLTGQIKVKLNSDQSIKVFGKSELKIIGPAKKTNE